MVLHEKGIDFEVHEVDLANKSEEFLRASPTGKVPVVVVDGDSIYESNVVNQYLDEVTPDGPKLMPEDPKKRAHARIWMAFADTDFFPAVFVTSVGRERGFSEERISEAREKLKTTLASWRGGWRAVTTSSRSSPWPTSPTPATSSACASWRRGESSSSTTTPTWRPGWVASRPARATR